MIPTNRRNWTRLYFYLVISLSTFISLTLAFTTYYINFWPTDSFYFYLPTARGLFHLPYISQMHLIPDSNTIGKFVMHGKESLILGIALFQKLLSDEKSLFPNILLLIICTQISAIAIYLIAKKIFNEHIGFICFLLYLFSLWPYIYLLQGAHQPLVLAFFLLSILSFIHGHRWASCYLLAGLCFGFMLFSSPTAILYLPYYAVSFLFIDKTRLHPIAVKKIAANTCLFSAGVAAVVLLFTWPHPVQAFKDFATFIGYSQHINHFDFYHEELHQYFPAPYKYNLGKPVSFRGAGLLWVIRYVCFLMPLLVIFYTVSLIALARNALKQQKNILIILLSLSTLVAVEISQVAQFGRNYYSWFIAIIFLIGFFLHQYRTSSFYQQYRPYVLAGLTAFLLMHGAYSANLFFTDLLPSRLATTHVHQWLTKHNIKKIHTYPGARINEYTIAVLNNPKAKTKIDVKGIKTILQIQEGYILIPPTTGKSIYVDCSDIDFERDPFLNELVETGHLEEFALAKFPTLASSKIWVQEEEVCTFRDLILKQIDATDRKKGYIYILDAKKLHQEWFNRP